MSNIPKMGHLTTPDDGYQRYDGMSSGYGDGITTGGN